MWGRSLPRSPVSLYILLHVTFPTPSAITACSLYVVPSACCHWMRCPQVTFKGEEKQFAAEEISSMVLTKMRETAEAFLGHAIKDAVVTVPGQ